MPHFLIELETRGSDSGVVRPESLCPRDLGARVQLARSYVTDDKVYGIYWAPDETLLRRRVAVMGMAASAIARVRTDVDATAA